jgi:sugar O-acyltransferase (sialic acid O-acetyltransferase NeuD family)
MAKSLQRLCIVGAGGHGRELAALVRSINECSPRFDLVGFVDDAPDCLPKDVLARTGLRVLGVVEDAPDAADCFVIGVGNPHERRSIAERLSGRIEAATLVHPRSELASSAELAAGAVMCFGTAVGPESSVGRHSHLNVRAVVGMGCSIGDFVSLSPGSLIEDYVLTDESAFVGTGAVVCRSVRVGKSATVGAGAVLASSLGPRGKATGNGLLIR